MMRRLGPVEIFDEGPDPAVVEEHRLLRLDPALVHQLDADARVEERQLAQAMLQGRVVVLDVAEGVGRGQEGEFGY